MLRDFNKILKQRSFEKLKNTNIIIKQGKVYFLLTGFPYTGNKNTGFQNNNLLDDNEVREIIWYINKINKTIKVLKPN